MVVLYIIAIWIIQINLMRFQFHNDYIDHSSIYHKLQLITLFNFNFTFYYRYHYPSMITQILDNYQQLKIPIMNPRDPHNQSCHQSTAIDSINCCNTIIKYYSAGNLRRHPMEVTLHTNPPRPTKGIKLTKSNKQIQPALEIKPFKIKQIQELQSYSNSTTARRALKQKDESDNDKKKCQNQTSQNTTLPVNSCKDYKNQKVQELTQAYVQHVPFNYSYRKESALYSTRKHTFQTITNSNDYPAIQGNNTQTLHQINQTPKLNSQYDKLRQYRQRIEIVPNTVTLQSFYEEKGRKKFTFQSQISQNDLHSNQYSVAEAFQFTRKFQR